MSKLFNSLGIVFNIIYPYSFHKKISAIKRRLYSEYLAYNFKSVGKETLIMRDSYIGGSKYICIGKKTTIQIGCTITAVESWSTGQKFDPMIKIGDEVNIGRYSHLSAIDLIEIGNGTRLGIGVTIVDNSHGRSNGKENLISPIKRSLYSKGPVRIGENVWIGDKVTILPNISIGNGSIIGANSVVTKDIPPFAIAVGNPAKIIGYNY